jgi:hypothetical protein
MSGSPSREQAGEWSGVGVGVTDVGLAGGDCLSEARQHGHGSADLADVLLEHSVAKSGRDPGNQALPTDQDLTLLVEGVKCRDVGFQNLRDTPEEQLHHVLGIERGREPLGRLLGGGQLRREVASLCLPAACHGFGTLQLGSPLRELGSQLPGITLRRLPPIYLLLLAIQRAEEEEEESSQRHPQAEAGKPERESSRIDAGGIERLIGEAKLPLRIGHLNRLRHVRPSAGIPTLVI